MFHPTARGILISAGIAVLGLSLAGCPSKSSASKLDGVYRSPTGGAATLTIKGGKAIMTIGTESHTMDYKVDGNKLTLIDPKEGNVVFTINDDGSLNGEMGVMQKSPN